MPELVGRRIGQYEITTLIGRGGMAAVYRAFQHGIDRDVAIKVIQDDDQARLGQVLDRFNREAQIMGALNHPNIIKVYDYGQQDDIVYMVMELFERGSLNKLIDASDGGLALEQIEHLLGDISAALDYAHSKGIIHRDLKPENILLNEHGQAFLMDFGIAKQITDAARLTQTGTILGSPAYMAPEQWIGEDVTHRIDIYALGIVLYEMFCGSLPYEDTSPHEILYNVLHQPPPLVTSVRPDLPHALDTLLANTLAREPMQRYESGAAILRDFREARAGSKIAAFGISAEQAEPTAATEVAPEQQQQTNNRTPLALLAGIVGVVVSIVVAVLLWNNFGAATVGTPLLLASQAPDIPNQFLFNRESTETQSIYISSVAGDDIQFLFTGGKPSWRERSTSFAFDFMEFEGENFEIYGVATIRSRNRLDLTDHPSADFHSSFAPGNPDLFVFHSDREEGNWDIYLRDLEADTTTRLTTSAAADQWPAWSPDGERILFSSQRDEGNFNIFTMALDGSDIQQLTTDGASDLYGAWSPDSQRIVFQSNRDGDYELFSMAADGTDLQKLTNNEWNDQWPAWSPTDYILFAGDSSGNTDLLLLDPETLAVYQLTDNAFNDRFPVWIGLPEAEE